MTFLLADLLKDSAYKLTQFSAEKIAALESAITIKDPGKKPAPYVTCLVRGKPIKLTPEEAIRQLYVMVLRDDLRYPANRFLSNTTSPVAVKRSVWTSAFSTKIKQPPRIFWSN